MMSNKNPHFVRRYTKRETSKRDFRIVKTWSTPKESDSEPHSGPSSSARKGLVPSSDLNSSDSSDVTYNPTESSELPSIAGQSTAPASTSETGAGLETDTPDTEGQQAEKETHGIEETETTPNETEIVSEAPYSSETHEYLPRSTVQSSENSPEGSSSPASTSTQDTSDSTSKDTSESTSKDSSDVSSSAKNSSRKGSKRREKTLKESSSLKDETDKNKWTVKNWKDVDILVDPQPLSPSLVSMDVPRPSGDDDWTTEDQGRRQENNGLPKEIQETIDNEEFPAPPDLVHEPNQESGDQGVDAREQNPDRPVYHEESPAPPELVHERSADQPLLEDSSLSSPSPVVADEPPELERNDTSDTNNASTVSTLSKTLSICLERIQVEQFQIKDYSDRKELSESSEMDTENKSPSEPEDKITSSEETRIKEYKVKGLGPKSVQMKRKAAKKASVYDCDSSTTEQISNTEDSTKEMQQLVSSSGKEPSISPPEKAQDVVLQASERDADDEVTDTPKGRKQKSKGRSTGKQRSTPKSKATPKKVVKQTSTRKITEKQSSPESCLASNSEVTTKSGKKKSVAVKVSPRKARSAAKASKQAIEQELNSEMDNPTENEEADNELIKHYGSRKDTNTSKQISPESGPASDVEKTSRTRKKKSVTPSMKETAKKSKAKAAKSQSVLEEDLPEQEQLSEKEDSAEQPDQKIETEIRRRSSSPKSGPESDGEETRGRKKKSVSSAPKEPSKKGKLSKRAQAQKKDLDEESLSDFAEDELPQQEIMTEQSLMQTGLDMGPESGPESDVEDRSTSQKKKSDMQVRSMSKKNKTSRTKTPKSNDADESSLSEQANYSEQEDSTKLPAAKKQPEMMKRPSKAPSRSRTPSSSTHEDDSTQAKRARLTPRARRSTEQEAVEDDDSHSVASSLRMEGVDFEKTPQIESDVTTKPGASPSSLWKGKKISALKPRAWSPRRREQTSSVASDEMSMVSSLPTEKKVTKRQPVKRRSPKQPKQVTAKKARAKPRLRREVGSDDEETHAGRSVTVWSQSNQPRRGADVLDLDIVLECLQSVEREMYEEAESRPCEKATQKVGSFVRKEIHKTISQVQEIKHNQSESKKLRSSVRSLRAELQDKQVSKIKLNSQLKKLKTRSGIDEELINLNSWLDDYDKLMNSWDQSKSSHSKQQKYRWIGDISDDMKALF